MDAPSIRFVANADKIVEALTWLANKVPNIDVFHACKVLFLADREHLRRYGRPILGDRYVAMEDGPVPSYAYYVAQQNGYHVEGIVLERASAAFSYKKIGKYPRLTPKRPADIKLFSRSDLACLDEMATKFGGMPFNQLWDFVHEDVAYNAAWNSVGPNSDMNYELLLDPNDPYYDDQVRDLRESAPYLTF
jgi:uncharacterized phage-associated protein